MIERVCLLPGGQSVVSFIKRYKEVDSGTGKNCRRQPTILMTLPMLAACISEHGKKILVPSEMIPTLFPRGNSYKLVENCCPPKHKQMIR